MAEITYYGHGCVRVRGREGVVLFDPYDRSIGMDIGKPTAHIVTISHAEPDHNNIASVKPMKDDLFIADGPGEYEVNNMLIRGVRTFRNDGEGKKGDFNTVFVVHVDDVAFCHLGDLGQKLTSSQLDEVGNVDVLFAPIGDGTWVLKPDMLSEVISDIEPKMVIPLYNDNIQQLLEKPHYEPLESFIHHMAIKEYQLQDKLAVTISTLPKDEEETQFAILKPLGVAV